MNVVVRLPAVLCHAGGGARALMAQGRTVREVIENLAGPDVPPLPRMIQDDELQPSVIVYLNGEDVRFLAGLNTEVQTGDELEILVAVAGG